MPDFIETNQEEARAEAMLTPEEQRLSQERSSFKEKKEQDIELSEQEKLLLKEARKYLQKNYGLAVVPALTPEWHESTPVPGTAPTSQWGCEHVSPLMEVSYGGYEGRIRDLNIVAPVDISLRIARQGSTTEAEIQSACKETLKALRGKPFRAMPLFALGEFEYDPAHSLVEQVEQARAGRPVEQIVSQIEQFSLGKNWLTPKYYMELISKGDLTAHKEVFLFWLDSEKKKPKQKTTLMD